VNVTDVPEHMLEVPDIETEGVTFVLTTIVTELLVAVVGLAHAAFDVITHETISPFNNPEFVYVVEFVPTFVPFNFHW
jgi:hypothetical protein